ncbi:MAG: hypothetical protein NTY93_00665 [Candidatus Kaiserbacteria bacterium]|nr:hypothetical protein [Candidatus Kaiserbacteria bacterium]
MPQKRNNPPPPVMTWMKALPVLIVAGIFDLVRIFFEQFWFFGPAVAALYCTTKVSGVVGMTVGSLLCGAGAGAVGYIGSGAIEAFGVVMAMAIGLFGWMTVGLILIMTNGRIFEENAGHSLWFAASLLISETPIIGTIPGLTGVTVKMYMTQIKKDKENLAKYEKEQAAQQSQEQNQKIIEFQQAREEIPEEMREAA